MTGRLKEWYPFLFAVLPILTILTRNPGGAQLDDALTVAATALLVCAVIYLGVRLALRHRSPAGLAPLVVFTLVGLIYEKSALGRMARPFQPAPPWMVLAGVLLLILLALWWLARRPHLLDRINTFLALTGCLLVGMQGIRFAAHEVRARAVIRNSALVRQLAAPIETRRAAGEQPGRDIYLIVLDEYANAGVLREEFGFSNQDFQDSLRHLGFTIPRLVRSNYVHTLLSIPSLLNFSHLTELSTEVGARSNDASLPNYLVENNRTVSFLRRQGVRFLFFPSQWWVSTRHSRNADWEFQAWSGLNPRRAITRSDLRRSLLSTTAFSFLQDPSWDADHIIRTLHALAAVPERPEPTFAFAHVVSPHWPYVFTADCRVQPPPRLRGRASRQHAYIGQLQCLNHLVLGTVKEILARSSEPPVILLQGDHGTNLLRYSDASSAAAVSPAQARERFGAFGAYYLPAGGEKLFSDTVTVVNVLQKVLSHYLGAEVSPAPDQLYMSLERTPYLFARVDPATLGP